MIEAHKYLITWISDDIFLNSAVIILGDSVQCTVEQSFFTKRFKLVEQRWRVYTWGGVRVALGCFANAAELFV